MIIDLSKIESDFDKSYEYFLDIRKFKIWQDVTIIFCEDGREFLYAINK